MKASPKPLPAPLSALGLFVETQTTARFATLEEVLRQASRKPKNPEAIHALRVAIRRTAECLRTFRQFFDPTERKQCQRKIKHLATDCGTVRNCDIALDLLKGAGLGRSKAAIEIRKRRRQMDRGLAMALRQWRNKKALKEWLVRPQVRQKAEGPWVGSRDVSHNAAGVLPGLFSDLMKAGAKASANGADHETIHKFRLLTKRFRYTLELFEPVYGREITRGLRLLRNLQNKLGAFNDCVTARELVTGHGKAEQAIERLLLRRKEALRAHWKSHWAVAARRLWTGWLRKPR